ncbi:hypothetical protein [Nocardia sp. NPDC057227]|uniref:hypothetical protein n=1 Tax=Nocardia sp. NPDC057227 TaxID=3346056 RepID=UPI00363936FA
MVAVLERRFTTYVEAMTLPVAATELLAWLDDQRQFLTIQHNDWQSMLSDFQLAYTATGNVLRTAIEAEHRVVANLAGTLFIETARNDGGTKIEIGEQVRAEMRTATAAFAHRLTCDDVITAAWQDLLRACQKPGTTVERIEYLRQTLWAITEARRQNIDGTFGLARELARVLRGDPGSTEHHHDSAAVTGLDTEAGPLPEWQRAQVCEKMLLDRAPKTDCVVWLRLGPAVPHTFETTHDQVTFYSAQLLGACVGHPEYARNFTVVPQEVLDLPTSVTTGPRRWSDEPDLVYARVQLPQIELHLASRVAATLVAALVQVGEPHPGTWELLAGRMVFVDGRLLSWPGWPPRTPRPQPVSAPAGDGVARRIELLDSTSQPLDRAKAEQLSAALTLSTALDRAHDEGPEAMVMAAVRAIEHVNAWAVGGRSDWSNFVRCYFKKATSRAQLVAYLDEFAMLATNEIPDPAPEAEPPPADLADIRDELWTYAGGVDYLDVGAAIPHLTRLQQIHHRDWLSRGLAELAALFGSGTAVTARLDVYGARFDIHLRRLKRIRNAAIHGGPVTAESCASIAEFAYHLGHLCLNQTITAHLTGTGIGTHMKEMRARERQRYERIWTDDRYDELFVATPI